MYKIIKPKNSPNIVWDSINNSVLGKFQNGIIETEDSGVAKRFSELGYNVTDSRDISSPGQETEQETKARPTKRKGAKDAG